MPAVNTDYKNSFDDPEPYLARIAGAGFTHIHWCHEWTKDRFYSDEEIDQIAAWIKRYSLQANDLHSTEGGKTPYYSVDPNKQIRGVELVKNRMDLASKIGTDVIVLHLSGSSKEGASEQAYQDAARQSLKVICEHGAARGVRVALENLFPTNHQVLDAMLGEFGPDEIGICYDSGHGNIVGDGLDYLERVTDRLIALHLNDNDGQGDLHQIPHEGTIDWGRLADILGRSGYSKPVQTYELMIRSSGFEDEHKYLVEARETAERFDATIENRP